MLRWLSSLKQVGHADQQDHGYSGKHCFRHGKLMSLWFPIVALADKLRSKPAVGNSLCG